MGKRGPAKTPTAVLKLRGSWRGNDRPDSDAPPTVKVEMPYRVKNKRYAKAYWKENYEFLADLGLMSGGSHIVFVEMAMVYHFLRTAELMMKGQLMYVPAYAKTYRDHRTDYLRLCKEFGCTPSSQANIKLTVAQAKEPTGKDRFFDKKFGTERA